MSVTQITIGSKTVLLAKPFAPTDGNDGEFVGRADELRLLLTGWITPRSGRSPFAPLLTGEPGVGKTRLAYHAAQLSDRDLYVFAGNNDVTAQELAVSVISSGDSESLRFEYVLSPLATAMVIGGVCLIDELGELTQSALAFLLPLLDGQRGFYSPLLGEPITAHPRFRFVATMNQTDPLATILNTNHKLARRLRPVIEVGEFSPEEIRLLIGRQFPVSQDNPRLLSCFWKCWLHRNEGAAPTPSDALYLFGMAENIAAAERLEVDGSWTSLEASSAVLKTEHIEAAFKQALGAVGPS